MNFNHADLLAVDLDLLRGVSRAVGQERAGRLSSPGPAWSGPVTSCPPAELAIRAALRG